MARSIARLPAVCLMDVGASVDGERARKRRGREEERSRQGSCRLACAFMVASFSSSVRGVGGSLLVLVALAPVVFAACNKTDAAPDAGPGAPPAAAAAANTAAAPTQAPLDTTNPETPGTPHPHPSPAHSGDAGANVPPPVMPTTIPLPSGITIPTALPTTIVVPSAIHLPPMPTASTPH
jgi:hypothetical protein